MAPTMTDSPQPPDLQEVIARVGGYGRMTREDWLAWDEATRRFWERRRQAFEAELSERRWWG